MSETTIKIDDLMNTSGVKFGTSGARGLVNDMTDAVCFAYTAAFLQYAGRHYAEKGFDRVAVGCDLRQSSPRIVAAVCRAVEACGLTPVDCGRIPSPAVALYGFMEKIPSLMVTGSHIPEDRNGIKFNLPTGEILKSDEIQIRQATVSVPNQLFDADGMLKPEAKATKTVSDGGAAKKRYIDRFVRAFPQHALSRLRLGLYEHSAVGRDLLHDLYAAMGATVTRLGRSNQFIAVDTEAVREEDLQLAKHWALGDDKHRRDDTTPFDGIVSTDGDSDRPLIFDELGNWIRGDVAGILTARFLLADCVVTPVSSSTALEKSGWFKKIVRTKIGSPYVVEAMQKAVGQGCKRVVGYEANGGFLTANSLFLDEEESTMPLTALPTRDPAIVHLAMLCMSKLYNETLSELVRILPRRVVMSDRLQNFPTELSKQKLDELATGDLETIQVVFAGFGELSAVDLTDGVRMMFGDQDIVHLRASGNAPELRCYTESDTQARATTLLCKTMTLLDSWRRRDQQGVNPYKQ